MTQLVDFLLHFLGKHNIKHNFYFVGEGFWFVKSPFVLWQASSLLICHILLAALFLNGLLIIWPTFTWTVLTWPTGARNPSMDSPYTLTNRSSKPLWTVLNLAKSTKPMWPFLNLNMGLNPHGQSLDLDILCVTYIESMVLKLTFYGDFIPNHNFLFISFHGNRYIVDIRMLLLHSLIL
jgi:hypothetical protein